MQEQEPQTRGQLQVPVWLRAAEEANAITHDEMKAIAQAMMQNDENRMRGELADPIDRVKLFLMDSPSPVLH